MTLFSFPKEIKTCHPHALLPHDDSADSLELSLSGKASKKNQDKKQNVFQENAPFTVLHLYRYHEGLSI